MRLGNAVGGNVVQGSYGITNEPLTPSPVSVDVPGLMAGIPSLGYEGDLNGMTAQSGPALGRGATGAGSAGSASTSASQTSTPGALQVIVNGTPGGRNPSQSLAYSNDVDASGYPLKVQDSGRANIYVNGYVDPVTGNFMAGAPSGASLSPEELDMARARGGYLDTNYDTPGGVTGAWHDVKDWFGAASPLLSVDQLAEKASIDSILATTTEAKSDTAFHDAAQILSIPAIGLEKLRGWANEVLPPSGSGPLRGGGGQLVDLLTVLPGLEEAAPAAVLARSGRLATGVDGVAISSERAALGHTTGAVGADAPGEALASWDYQSSRATQRYGINFFRESKIRAQMAQTPAGQMVLDAANSGDIDLVFSSELHPEPGLFGDMYPGMGGTVPTATVYLKNVQNGRSYDLLGIDASGYDLTSTTAIHEGLHALGVGGSQRAEALVRLEELRSLGVPIDRTAMRQVLTDMKGNYDSLPWMSGGATPYFPDLIF